MAGVRLPRSRQRPTTATGSPDGRRKETSCRSPHPTAATTSLSVNDGGGATAVADFEAVFSATFSVDRRSPDRCDIVVAGADLPAQLDVEGVSPDTMDVGVNLGENAPCVSGGRLAAGRRGVHLLVPALRMERRRLGT